MTPHDAKICLAVFSGMTEVLADSIARKGRPASKRIARRIITYQSRILEVVQMLEDIEKSPRYWLCYVKRGFYDEDPGACFGFGGKPRGGHEDCGFRKLLGEESNAVTHDGYSGTGEAHDVSEIRNEPESDAEPNPTHQTVRRKEDIMDARGTVQRRG
jgi:hypothetical protein